MTFHQVDRAAALQIMMSNVDAYERRIQEARLSGAQIIVFPEDGLYGAYFPSREFVRPYLEVLPSQIGTRACGSDFWRQTSPVFERLSCLAELYRMIVVVTIGELQPCRHGDNVQSKSNDAHQCSNDGDNVQSNANDARQCSNGDDNDGSTRECPNDGAFQFNAQIAIDESGALLAKYHKSNLFYEPEWDASLTPNVPVTFDASFGVRFGMLICFDILRPAPQLALLADASVTDLLLSSWWVNNAPEITGTQMHQAWSNQHGRNLLAASVGTNFYNSGSGLYTPLSVLRTVYNPTFEPHSRLLVAAVPMLAGAPARVLGAGDHASASVVSGNAQRQKYIGVPHEQPYYDMQRFVASRGAHGTLEVNAGNQTRCRLTYSVSSSAGNESFALVAQNGLYNGVFNASVCSLNRCAVDDNCSVWTLRSSTTFASFRLEAVSIDNRYTLLATLPMIDRRNAQLIGDKRYRRAIANGSNALIEIVDPLENLLSASLFNVFE
jgi:predicted amidohydrolase